MIYPIAFQHKVFPVANKVLLCANETVKVFNETNEHEALK